MPTTRSSSQRSAGSPSSSPASSQTKSGGGAGTKRKAEGTPTKAKRGKKNEDHQKTIEETMNKTNDQGKDVQMKDQGNDEKADSNGTHTKEESKGEKEQNVEQTEPTTGEEREMIEAAKQAEPEASKEDKVVPKSDKEGKDQSDSKEGSKSVPNDDESKQQNTSNDDAHGDAQGNTDQQNVAHNESLVKQEPGKAITQEESREKAQPSNILEKGLIYFFTRGRVGLEDPSSVTDIARSYFILRPMPRGGSLADSEPVGDNSKSRIIALPKKVLPASRKDTFLCFVESAEASFEDLRTKHLQHSSYATKTTGTSTSPAAKPIAEGVYALTTTGRESHLVYMLSVPEELGEVQKDLGLASKGAFVTSVRNPNTSAPAGAAPEKRAAYPQAMMDDFRSLRWGRLEPAHLDYEDTQFLLIGEGENDNLEKSVDAEQGDGKKEGKKEPVEEIELLSDEDRQRIKNLSGDDSDAIFKDLGLSKEEYSKIQTSWE